MSLDLLLTRRSIRKYTEDDVSEEVVRDLLRAAMSAPSAGNQRPWHFVVIKAKETLQKMAASHPHGAMAAGARLAILVCGDANLERQQGYWVQDCSAAVQNLLLAAHAKGLGAVWVGIYPREERVSDFRFLIGAPANIIPFALIPLGYPAESPAHKDRMDKSRVHYDCW